jgi:NAD(P)H-hydrate epimerase
MELEAGKPVTVLKGAGTIVTDGERLFKNTTGNPGMATGGSGDVLTGVIAALIGQRMPPFDAAVLGVHVHGIAGDIAARKLGEASMTASDLIDYLPEAFQKIR